MAQDMTAGRPARLLLTFSLPILLGNILGGWGQWRCVLCDSRLGDGDGGGVCNSSGTAVRRTGL